MILNNRHRYIIFVLMCLLVVVILLIFLASRPDNLEKTSYAAIGGDFTLTSESGPVSLFDYHGQVVLLFFGYASCPDYCPTELARIGSTIRKLSNTDIDQTQGIFVSIDPARDSIEEVSAYAKFFHKNIIGLTGTAEQVSQVADKYFAFYEIVENKDSSTEYTVDHSLTTYLIGRDGQVVDLIKRDWTSSEIAQAIRLALRK
jgi:protein SCO1/2